jgi:16S rRNA (cytidine1402-2'-O)-methyltransferase
MGGLRGLYVVATPIGNMGDMTFRAVETLRGVDVVCAEDTRRARALLTHFEVAKKEILRLDASASPGDIAHVVERLASGASVAVVTDAGTPVVSDPGAALVHAAREQGITVTPIPGASALTTLLSASGFDAKAVRFIGFLPRAGTDREAAIALMASSADATIFFEAPHRMRETLELLAARMPRRQVVIGRELTKMHEELLAGELGTMATEEREREWLGEIAVAVAPDAVSKEEVTTETLDARIDEELARGRRSKDIAELLAVETGASKRAVYERVLAKRGR